MAALVGISGQYFFFESLKLISTRLLLVLIFFGRNITRIFVVSLEMCRVIPVGIARSSFYASHNVVVDFGIFPGLFDCRA